MYLKEWKWVEFGKWLWEVFDLGVTSVDISTFGSTLKVMCKVQNRSKEVSPVETAKVKSCFLGFVFPHVFSWFSLLPDLQLPHL